MFGVHNIEDTTIILNMNLFARFLVLLSFDMPTMEWFATVILLSSLVANHITYEI